MAEDYMSMVKHTGKLPIYNDISTLDIYCEYLLNDSDKNISYSNLLNLKEFVGKMDTEVLNTADSKMARYEFLKLYLEARVDLGTETRKLCLKHIMNNCHAQYRDVIKREILDSIEQDNLKKKDVIFVNNMVFAQLNTLFMHEYKKPLMQLLDDVDSNKFGMTPSMCNDAIDLFQHMLTDLTKAQRRSRKENRLSLSDPELFDEAMDDAIVRNLSDETHWKTGWQGVNKMLGGGFECGRIYNFIGATGGFKSGLLLNIMKSIKLYNKGMPHKYPEKRPTILFISQENTVWETVSRIFGIFGTTESIKKYSKTEIMDILKKGGFCVTDDVNDIDIEFRYYGNLEVGVRDLKGICEEMDNAGREVICILQDYIERLRPPQAGVEKRIQLADISNELHDLACELDIPIITGSQLNRTGMAIIEQMSAANKHDIGKMVGTKDVSESYAMLKNFDVNIMIIVEHSTEEDRYYLSFKLLKFRGDDRGVVYYLYQPFVGKNSKIQLMDDLYAKEPVYRGSLEGDSVLKLREDSERAEDLARLKASILTDGFNIGTLVKDKKKKKKCEKEFITLKKIPRDKNGFIMLKEIPRDKDGFIVLNSIEKAV